MALGPPAHGDILAHLRSAYLTIAHPAQMPDERRALDIPIQEGRLQDPRVQVRYSHREAGFGCSVPENVNPSAIPSRTFSGAASLPYGETVSRSACPSGDGTGASV